jgi:hypothetical protein
LCSLEKILGVQAIAMSDFPRKFPQFTSCWKESANKTENGETTSPKKKSTLTSELRPAGYRSRGGCRINI